MHKRSESDSTVSLSAHETLEIPVNQQTGSNAEASQEFMYGASEGNEYITNDEQNN